MSKTPDTSDLQRHAQDVSALLKTLCHANRLLIACTLKEGEKNVSQIEADIGVPQPHLSRDLGRLRDAGLISARRESKNVYYSITDPRLVKVIDALCTAFAPEQS